jgi:hypothetical protein
MQRGASGHLWGAIKVEIQDPSLCRWVTQRVIYQDVNGAVHELLGDASGNWTDINLMQQAGLRYPAPSGMAVAGYAVNAAQPWRAAEYHRSRLLRGQIPSRVSLELTYDGLAD